MQHSTKFYQFCVIVSFSLVACVQAYSDKYAYSDKASLTRYTPEIFKNRFSTAAMMITTECETPNRDTGLCMEIQQCGKLLKQLNNPEANEFLRASMCGPSNENVYKPKVCCGRYDNFKRISSNRDDNIFPKVCGKQNEVFDRRIVGGKEALLGEYPWMARLVYRNDIGVKSFGCSGFLIHPNFIITAAHCTHPSNIQMKGQLDSVVLGEHDATTKTDCSRGGTLCAQPIQTRRVTKVTYHPDYNPKNIVRYNDIAIVHIRQPAKISNFVRPICLPKNGIETPARYYLSGWGTTEKELESDIKMKIEIPYFNRYKCIDKYSAQGIVIKDNQICAGGEYERDSCTGDSGGPLMMVDDDETWYAAGVVSFGMGCGQKGWPGVYTNVAKFLPWIKSEMTLIMNNNFNNRGRRRYREAS